MHLCYKLSCSLHLVSLYIHKSLVSTRTVLLCLQEHVYPIFVRTRVCAMHTDTQMHTMYTHSHLFPVVFNLSAYQQVRTRTTYLRSNVAQTTMLCISVAPCILFLRSTDWMQVKCTRESMYRFPCKEKVPKVVVKLVAV